MTTVTVSESPASILAGRIARRLIEGAPNPAELDAHDQTAYPAASLDESWQRYRQTIEQLGNPPDQIARFERARIVLQPKQLEFAAWARRLDSADHIEGELGSPELGFGGARGPGKSFGIFAQMAVDDCQRYAGLKCLYLRKTGLRAREQLEDLIASVLQHVPHDYTRGLVRFPNGSYIIIGHFQTESEAMNYLGMEYDIIDTEEATQLRERVHHALNQSLRSSKPGWRPRHYNSTNPLGVGHKYYKTHFIDHERKNTTVLNRTRKFIFATVDDNRFAHEDYRGNLERLSGVERRAYLEGDWEVSAGAYFDQWRYELHVKPALIPPRPWSTWASMDYGFNHWNIIYLHARSDDGVIYTFAEIAHRKHYPEQIVHDLRARLMEYHLTISHLDRFYAGADVFNKTGASEKSIAEQYEKFGITFTPAQTSPGSRVGRAHHLAHLLGQPDRGIAPTWFATEACPMLIETMPYLEADPNHPEDVLKVDCDEYGQGGDDPYDALTYGLFTRHLPPRQAEYIRYA